MHSDRIGLKSLLDKVVTAEEAARFVKNGMTIGMSGFYPGGRSQGGPVDEEAKAFLQRGMTLAMEWAVRGLVMPHIGRTIDSTVEAINDGLQSLKAGTDALGKVAVIVDRDLAMEAQ